MDDVRLLLAVLLLAVLSIVFYAFGPALSRLTHLPVITIYLAAGLLSQIFMPSSVHKPLQLLLAPVHDAALGCITLAAGGELVLEQLRANARAISCITLWLSLASLCLVFPVTLFVLVRFEPLGPGPLSLKIVMAMCAAVVSIARSPSSAIAVVAEQRADGPFTQTVLGVTMVTDVVVVVLFTAAIELADSARWRGPHCQLLSCHSSLPWPLGAGSPGSWLRYTHEMRRPSHARAHMGGCSVAVRPGRSRQSRRSRRPLRPRRFRGVARAGGPSTRPCHEWPREQPGAHHRLQQPRAAPDRVRTIVCMTVGSLRIGLATTRRAGSPGDPSHPPLTHARWPIAAVSMHTAPPPAWQSLDGVRLLGGHGGLLAAQATARLRAARGRPAAPGRPNLLDGRTARHKRNSPGAAPELAGYAPLRPRLAVLGSASLPGGRRPGRWAPSLACLGRPSSPPPQSVDAAAPLTPPPL